ncbi:hypothetical protein [Streptomyces sp. XD-27]|uniref:hypothetical protein n=1 Tax=Streptomyces sp. XD-27 TaxID=3062779 RepID=UPI0026F46E32|nr:hypothetical protein [Streptomyces sp. XD-27]WKX71360.1 hypothetical protein Q3Y56_16915 [Streptomyces sp. XD-27]
MRKSIAGITLAVAAAVLVSGCGGSEDGDKDSSRDTGTDSGKEKTSKSAPAKPLPVESTVRQATWTSSIVKGTESRDTTHQLKIAPRRLTQGTAADLEHVPLGDELQGMVPHYLTVSYTNTGSEPLIHPDPEDNFTITLADGTPGKVFSLSETTPHASPSGSGQPNNCDESGGGESLDAGATATRCQVVMLPKGHKPATVAYSDEAGGTLLWKVGDGKGDGKLLPAGKTADSAWKDSLSKGESVPIRVTPKSVRAGSLADLRDYDLGDDRKNLVPWYVTLEYRNVGKEELLPMMDDDGVGVRTAGGLDVQSANLLDLSFSGEGDGIDGCRGHASKDRLRPNSALSLCTIHLIPKGDRPAVVSFRGKGKAAHPLVWRAS